MKFTIYSISARYIYTFCVSCEHIFNKRWRITGSGRQCCKRKQYERKNIDCHKTEYLDIIKKWQPKMHVAYLRCRNKPSTQSKLRNVLKAMENLTQNYKDASDDVQILSTTLRNRIISLTIKMRVFQCYTIRTVLYGSECCIIF